MGDTSSTSALYSARPRLTVNGLQDPALDSGLLSMSVHETTEGLYNCELTLSNWGSAGGDVDYLYFNRDVMDYGGQICIEIGSGDASANIFEGRISAIEGRYPKESPPEILLLAEDRLQDLRMVRRSRTFEDVTDEDIITRIAGEHGLTPDTDINGPSYRVVAQLNQSDLAFLRERVRAIDAELWVDGNTLHAVSRPGRRTGELTLTYGEGLHEFSVLSDLSHQRTHLAVCGWEIQTKETLEYEVDETRIRSEINGGLSGSHILENTFGRRSERIVHLAPLSDQESRTLSETYYKRIARQFVRGHGMGEGDGRIRAGSRINFQGLGDLFNGPYYVTEATHSFNAIQGYRTRFRVERPFIGQG